MKLFKITDGMEHCYVAAENKEQALEIEDVKEYFIDSLEDGYDLEVSELSDDTSLEFDIEGTKETRTAKEWVIIFKANNSQIIARSIY